MLLNYLHDHDDDKFLCSQKRYLVRICFNLRMNQISVISSNFESFLSIIECLTDLAVINTLSVIFLCWVTFVRWFLKQFQKRSGTKSTQGMTCMACSFFKFIGIFFENLIWLLNYVINILKICKDISFRIKIHVC